MELEELKSKWEVLSNTLDNQQKLTDKIIIKMTQDQYQNRINNIAFPETIGAVACFVFFLLTISFFNRLDTWYLRACGVFSAAFFLVFPLLSLWNINKMRQINVVQNYRQSLLEFAKRRHQFLLIQQVGVVGGFVLMVACLPVASKIMSNKDLFIGHSTVWYLYLPIGATFLFFFSRWAYSCYYRMTKKTEELLKGINQEVHQF